MALAEMYCRFRLKPVIIRHMVNGLKSISIDFEYYTYTEHTLNTTYINDKPLVVGRQNILVSSYSSYHAKFI